MDWRCNLERLAPQVGAECIKVFHIHAAHWLFHTTAQQNRLMDLCQRRGVALPPRKTVGPNRGIETADCGTVLGNDFTANSFSYAGKPLFRVPLSSPMTWPFPTSKNFEESRKTFLWFGSDGFVHKGLDLVLEAFVDLPDLQLIVAGPIDSEPLFRDAFQQELEDTPNIQTLGWLDTATARFLEVAGQAAFVLFPSCSEGGGGGVLTCMHAGLIPIVTREASVDIGDFGWWLETASIAEIRTVIRQAAKQSPGRLREQALMAWNFARANHTQERFRIRFREVAESIIHRRWDEADWLAAPVPSGAFSQ
jgi:glycosyltransferase involved in cell wall biosynthesis